MHSQSPLNLVLLNCILAILHITFFLSYLNSYFEWYDFENKKKNIFYNFVVMFCNVALGSSRIKGSCSQESQAPDSILIFSTLTWVSKKMKKLLFLDIKELVFFKRANFHKNWEGRTSIFALFANGTNQPTSTFGFKREMITYYDIKKQIELIFPLYLNTICKF